MKSRYDAIGGMKKNISRWEETETALVRMQWAYEALHLSQAAFIKRLIDLPLSDFLGSHKSASTIKSYLQGNIPKNTPELFDKLILAAAFIFNQEPGLFYDASIGKDIFVSRIRNADGQNNRTVRALLHENERLKERVTTLESRLGDMPEISGHLQGDPQAFHDTPAIQGRRLRPRHRYKTRHSFNLIVVILFFVVFGGFLVRGMYMPDDPYPPSRTPEIRRATLDGRDLSLNSATTPMRVAYGSSLCVTLASHTLYASVFVEDRGFYFNQEGRLLISPQNPGDKCTGIWPGMPDAFHKSPYRLFIVVSEDRLPVSGDSDRRQAIPPGRYFGPVYIQRTD